MEDTIDGGITNAVQFMNNKPVARWARHPNQGHQLRLYWVSPQRPSLSSIPADKLRARCKCRGVEFWVTRPASGLRSQVKLGHHNSFLLDNCMEPHATATFEVEPDHIF